MKLFTLINKGSVHLTGDRKIISGDEVATLKSASEIVELAKSDAEEYKKATEVECEALKKEAEKEGFEEGIKRWNEEIFHLEEEMFKLKAEMQKTLLPLVMLAIRKILGKELEVHPEALVDVIANALKSVSQHRKITIYVRKADLELLEKERPRIKGLFENLQSLTLASKDEIEEGSCVIETERGILNVSIESQLKAIEEAFSKALKQETEGS